MRPLADRFWSKVGIADGCWEWTASVDKNGYGQISNECSPRTMLKAHRLMWTFMYGFVPSSMCVCHRCDNRRCVNPSHLFLGSQGDNMRDMTSKGRNTFQIRNPSTKLSIDDVQMIRLRRDQGLLLRDIAMEFGVRESTVSRIANGVRRSGVA